MSSLQKKEEEESTQRFVSWCRHCKKRGGGEYTEVCKLVTSLQKKEEEESYVGVVSWCRHCKKKEEEESIQRFVSCGVIAKKRGGGEYTEVCKL